MRRAPILAALSLAVLSSTSQAQPAEEPYWKAKASCWAELAAAERSQGDEHGTPATAQGNADRINQALAAGGRPTAATEQPIFWKKIMPSTNSSTGRPQWAADLAKIDAVADRYRAASCRTEVSACLEVAQQSAWENMEESQGARWNHGRPEIDKALALANKANAEYDAKCEKPPAPIFIQKAPEPGVAERITISASALFDFDSSVLKKEGRSSIAELTARLPNSARVKVLGYTDRFGTSSYNVKLSKQRAEAVKSVLQAANASIQVDAEGKGDADPVVTCPGPKSAKTIACLQPNRRVTVDILN